MSPNEKPNQALQPISEIDQTIHSPTRLKILAFLSIVESADFTFLLGQTGLTRGNLSANLRKLEEVGYINVRKEFVDRIPRTLIRLSDDGKKAINSYRENMRQILDGLLGE